MQPCAPFSNTSMKIVYILNEFEFYLSLAVCSMTTLRRYNPDIPVEVFYVCDKGENNRNLGRIPSGNMPKVTRDAFLRFCSEKNVTVRMVEDLDMGSESRYAPVQRMCLSSLGDERVMLMDADTFVFGDVSALFGLLDDCDFVADKNNYGEKATITHNGVCLRPFNSGVTLWGGGMLREYAKVVYDYCLALKERRHYLGEWLYKVSPDAIGREELACTLFVADRKLRFRYFSQSEVQTGTHQGDTLIYHTLTQNWMESYFRLRGHVFGESRNKPNIKPMLVSRKKRFT